MYVTLLLLAPALCEWVEISQRHYSRKPTRTHPFLTAITEDHQQTTINTLKRTSKPHRPLNTPFKQDTETYEETTSQYRKPVRTQYFPAEGGTEVFVEDDPSDSSRYQNRKPTRTEDYEASTTRYKKPTHTRFSVDRIDQDEVEFEKRIYLNQSISATNSWNKANVNKVSKHGNVQRVQLDSNPVKAPNIIKPMRNSVNFGNHGLKSDVTDISEIVASTHNENTDEIKPSKNRVPPEFTDDVFEKPIHRDPYLKNKGILKQTSKPINNVTMQTSIRHKPNTFIQNTEDEFDPADLLKNRERNKNSEINSNNDKTVSKVRDDSTRNEQIPNRINGQNIKGAKISPIEEQTKSSATVLKKPDDEDFATVSEDHDEPKVTSQNKVNQIRNEEESESNSEEETSKEPSNDSKANTLESLMTLMKVVADTIRRNTRRSVNSKTKYLTNLKHTILSAIKDRIDSTWPDDPPAHARVSRAAAAARGHVEIPSAESALMTISFLTFAVFLIKLVLQIIQAYKNKTMMVTPAVVATVGRVAAASKRYAKP